MRHKQDKYTTMKLKSKVKNINHPANLTYKQVLKRKDPLEIAEKSGFSVEHVRKVLRGERGMDEKILSAIDKILKRRELIEKRINDYSKITA